MTGLWIILCASVSASGCFVMNCQCDYNSAFAEFISDTDDYESSSCKLCDDSNFDPLPWEVPDDSHPNPPPPISPSPMGPTGGPPLPPCLEASQTILNNQTIVWPTTDEFTEVVSIPLCLDETLRIVKRKCNEEWDPNPTCAGIQQPINPCPADLTSINGRYCYTIVEKTKFPPNCPYPGPLGWDEYVDLGLFSNKPVWMPVKRNDSIIYGIDVFRYTELTSKYNIPFQICTQSCRTFFYKDTFLDKECLVYHNSTHVEAVSCDDEYSAICIYDALPYRQSSLCEQTFSKCKQGSYKSDSDCFCETTSRDVGEPVLAEFLLPYQNLLFTNLNNRSCRIGLINTFADSSTSFLWKTSRTTLNYTNWAPDVNFSNEYGVLTSEGWMLTDLISDADCSIYQIPVTKKKAKLSLKIENNSYKLTVYNYTSFLSKNNSEPVVYCFSDADAKTIIYRVTNMTQEPTTDTDTYVVQFSSINLDQSGPGNYWCQAFLYPNLAVTTSNTKMIMNFTAEYVVLFRLKKYDEKLSSYPLTPENLETLQNLFRNELPNNVSFYPRIFKINGIDEANNEINITFHLTSSVALGTEQEFDNLRQICMGQSMFEFLEFRNVHYCPNSTTQHAGQKIFWPRIVWSQKTSPINGYCITTDVNIIERTCIGNFVDGVYWSDIGDICQFYAASSLTEKIINISNRSGDDEFKAALTELHEISNEYGTFNTLDFVLAANFIRDISLMKPDLDILAGIINNLMKIRRAVLLSAQLNFRATDILLQSVDTAIGKESFGQWNRSHFAVKSVDIKTDGIRGFHLQNCENFTNCYLIPITNSSYLFNQSFVASENLNAAITLSTELYDQIINYSNSNESYIPKLAVSIYYGSQLFVELENSKSSNLVFGVLLPEFSEEFEGPVSIYYYTNLKSKILEYNCSYWKFNDTNKSSWAAENTEELEGAVVCEFYHITNFGIPFTVSNQDITNNNYNNDVYTNICIPDNEVTKKCFTKNHFINDQTCIISDLVALLVEYCLTEYSMAEMKICLQNLTTEELFSNMSSHCTAHELSVSINIILGAIETFGDDFCDFILDLLLTVTANYKSMTDAKVLFVASSLKAVSNHSMDMSKITGIINNLMEVPSSVMYSAQQNFRAVDVLLNTIEEALATAEYGEWTSKKFLVRCLNIDEHKGLLLKNCSPDLKECSLELINSSYMSLNKNIKSDNSIYAVVALSDILYNQILTYSEMNSSYTPKMIISIYYESKLFVDLENAAPAASNIIFGVLLPEFDRKFEGPLQIYYLKNPNNVTFDCSYWTFNESTFGTWVVEYSLVNNRVALCEFNHLSNFAISVTPLNHSRLFSDACYITTENHEIITNENYESLGNSMFSNIFISFNKKYVADVFMTNITKKIYTDSFLEKWSMKILPDNYLNLHCRNATDTEQKSCELFEPDTADLDIKHINTQHINFYDDFLNNLNEYNVGIICKILEKADPSNTTLESLATLIDMCIDPNTKVKFGTPESSDKLLYSIDRHLQIFKNTDQVKRPNLLLITVSKQDVEYFDGFFVTKDKDAVCIFQNNSTLLGGDDIDNYATVLISPALRRQIKHIGSSLIFAIFFSTALFPTTDETVVNLPIIEVLIPDLHDDLEGNIIIQYKYSQKGKCCYWDHRIEGNKIMKSGYWKTEFYAESNGRYITCNFQHVTHFALVASSQNITTDLEQILASNLTGLEKLKQVDRITGANHNNLVAIDIYLISQIITHSLSEGAIPAVITRIISSLFMVPRNILKESQKVHSATDIILYAVDEMSRMVSELEIHHKNFSLIIKNLENTNLTGVMLYGCQGFQCSIEELDQFINITEFVTNKSMSAMVIFSEELVKQIRNFSDNPKIVISIYYSDVLFNEIGNARNTSKIFGVVFPGIPDPLGGTVSIIHNIKAIPTNDSNQCAYWHYKADPTGNKDNAILGQWVKDTNKQLINNMIICNYSHVTHFGMLLANSDDYVDDPILDLITDTGCVLSLFGTSIILLTAILFKKWRQNTGNKILMNFSVAISLKIITMYVSFYVKSTTYGISCTITGLILHYALLCECAWMLTVAILQFKRFVEVLGGPPKYVLVKALICGWVFPTIPVICVIVIDSDNYEKGVVHLCYPSNLGLYLGVWLPVLLILTLNCIIFTFIIYNVFHKKTEYIDGSNHEILFQWRLALLLFFMLGLNYVFGFLGQIRGDTLFTYLFSVTASLQGFVLFLFFIVFNKSTRILYSQAIKQWFYVRGIFRVWQSKPNARPKY